MKKDRFDEAAARLLEKQKNIEIAVLDEAGPETFDEVDRRRELVAELLREEFGGS